MSNQAIPLFEPFVGKEEKSALAKVIDGKELSRGPWVERFESSFAEYVGKKHAIAVNNGTSGLHLCVKAMRWTSDDEIITTPYSFIASTNCLLYENIKPIFCDISPKTFNITASNIIPKISKKTKGILIVDILGLPAVSNEVDDLCKNYNLNLIEDACEAIGRRTSEFPVATFSEMAVYGFYPNKQMTTAEGGMIVTDNKDLAEYLYSARNQGYSTAENWLENVILGYNYRMSDIQAAIGISQLGKLDKMLERRTEIAEMYNHFLNNIPGIELYSNNGLKRSYFNYTILIKNSQQRKKIINRFRNEKIGYNLGFTPLHYFPHIRKLGYQRGDFPVTELISEQTLALPFFVNITTNQIKKVCDCIKGEIM